MRFNMQRRVAEDQHKHLQSGTAERNLEWGDPSSKAEGAIHLGGSERIGPRNFEN